jgi:hypothetical protein
MLSDCPFSGLEFTTVVERDTSTKNLQVLDSLYANLNADLNSMDGEGSLRNDFLLNLQRWLSSSSLREVRIADEEFANFLQARTKALCGLYLTLNNSDVLSSASVNEKAQELLLDMISNLLSYRSN